jgi:hypothetical protein
MLSAKHCGQNLWGVIHPKRRVPAMTLTSRTLKGTMSNFVQQYYYVTKAANQQSDRGNAEMASIN